MVQQSPTQTGPAAQIHKGNDIIIMTHRGELGRKWRSGENQEGGEEERSSAAFCLRSLNWGKRFVLTPTACCAAD